MKNLEIELVDDWRDFHKWSSMRLAAAFAFLYMTVPHLLPLLADHWPEVAPWVMHFFPSAPASIVPVIGLLLMAAARVTKIGRGGDQ